MDFNNKILNAFKSINLDLTENEINTFKMYMDLLLEWNNKINLTAITEEDEIILKHFVDSCSIIKYIKNEDKLIDIGTGAGFPGIPLKVINKDIHITLMDSLNKRINFLNEVINKLSLENINAIHSRAEDLARNKDYREMYDVAVSRAVANLSTLSEYMLPFVKVGGKCICMKGPNIDEELENAKGAITKLGGRIKYIDNFKLGNTENERNIIVIEKIKETSKMFPRKAGLPSKEPLK